jgi:hypothetical protein
MSLSDFVLAGPRGAAYLDTVVLSHPSWSQEYRVVRNAVSGITATLETAAVVEFSYYPLVVKPPGARQGLQLELAVELGDLGEVLPAELDRMRAAGTMYVRPALVYRAFRSDDLAGGPIVGPWSFEVYQISASLSGSTLSARTRASSPARTGRLYQSRLFPTLRTP